MLSYEKKRLKCGADGFGVEAMIKEKRQAIHQLNDEIFELQKLCNHEWEIIEEKPTGTKTMIGDEWKKISTCPLCGADKYGYFYRMQL
jgi:hypothetical protein